MLTLRILVNDGSVTIETTRWFTYDSETSEMKYLDSENDECFVNTKTADKVYVYAPGGLVIFTRDLTTMRPIGGYDV